MFKNLTKKLLAMSFTCISIPCAASEAVPPQHIPDSPPLCNDKCESSRVSVRHIENKGIGYNTGYTTVEGFFAAPADLWSVMPFLDLRGHIFNDGHWAANGGVGLRSLLSDRIYGAYVYYDYRDTQRKNYNQVSFGVETLGTFWDLRMNGYVVVGSRKTRNYQTQFSEFAGNNIFLTQKFQYALSGGNAEAGFYPLKMRNVTLYTGFGPYYLKGPDGDALWGGQVRTKAMWKNYMGAEISYSYDHTFKNIVQGQLFLSYPLGPKGKARGSKERSCIDNNLLCHRMMEHVAKSEIIPVSTKKVKKLAINPATGQPFTVFFVNNLSHSLGTYESPYNTLADAQNASNANDIIYVFPGDGTSTGMNGGIQLKNNQKLWGSVVQQNLRTTVGNITIPALSKGGIVQGTVVMPVITNATDDTVVSIASGNEISGLYIQNVGGSSTAIANSSEATNLTVLNCTIGGPGSTPYAGIGLTDLGGTLTVSHCTINEAYGISIYNTTQNLVANISNSNFNGGANGSIYWLYNGPVQGTLKVENCTINSAGDAVNIQQVTGSSMIATLNKNQMISANIGVNMVGAGTASQMLSMTGNTILSNNQTVYITQTDTLSANFTANTLISTDDTYTFELDSNAGSTNATLTFTDNTLISQFGGSLYFNQSAGSVVASMVGNIITPYDGGEGLYINMATDASSYTLSFNNNSINGGEYGFYVDQTVGNFTADCNNNTIDAPYEGYGIYANAAGSSFALSLNDSTLTSSYYGIYLTQTTGTMNVTLNGNQLTTGSDDYTVYFDLEGGTSSQMSMDSNTLVGYYAVYLSQSASNSTNLSFTNNTVLAGYYGLIADIASGTDNSCTVSGNTLIGGDPIYIDQYGGDWNYVMTGNTIASTGTGNSAYTYTNSSGTVNSIQTISSNTLSSSGGSAINISSTATVGSLSATISGNTLSSTTYAVATSFGTGTVGVDVSNNILTNSGGINLGMTGGTESWQVAGNQFTSMSTAAVNAVASGGTVSCMQLNNNAVYPTSSTNAYVLNGTGATSFTLNTPTGNTGNTNIQTTDVTQGSCP